METWKNIEETNNLYQISNFGRVKSLPKIVRNKQCQYLNKEQILKTTKNAKGYERIRVSNGIKKITLRVHRLVAKYFIENPLKHKEVNHKDFNKSNNVNSNLEWCSRQHNIDHYFKRDTNPICQIKT